MARARSFEAAGDALRAHFAELLKLGGHVFTRSALNAMLAENRELWKIAQKYSATDFIEFLLQDKDLQHVELVSENYGRLDRFVLGTISPYQIALSLKPHAYLSHGTAVLLHGLTEQIPKTIYVNHEQRAKAQTSALSQTGLELAFSRPQRTSNYVFAWGEYRIVVVNGKFTERLEVGAMEDPVAQREMVPATKLERTLIDIVVRPAYAGGIYQVVEAYKGARGKLSPNVLVATLKKLGYIYPYHQAIGFLMQRAGYEESQYSRLRTLGFEHDFYLVHGMKETDYDERWRLFYPKGLEA